MKLSSPDKTRCPWPGTDPLYVDYHDQEWGVPIYDKQKLFEFLILEGMQAGLSWITVLRKREHYRKVFNQFNAEKIARYSPSKIEKLLLDPGIIRNRLKVEGTVKNAKAYLKLQEQIDFSDFLWQFTEGKILQNKRKKMSDIPTHTKESDAMAKELKKCGFTFVGTTICYAHMQATGMVNDHLTSCFRHAELL
jgi:DNA-3-methyladenine glycosylase I